MKIQRKDWLILIVPLIIVALLYPMLPDRIPRQIGLRGEVKYAAKEFIFILGFVPFLLMMYYKAKKK